MGDPHDDVKRQIKELQQHVQTATDRTEARIAGLERQLADLIAGFEKLMVVSFNRGFSHGQHAGPADGALKVVPEPDEGLRHGLGRHRVAAAISAAAVIVATAGYLLSAGGDPTAGQRSARDGWGTVTRGQDATHGPPVFPLPTATAATPLSPPPPGQGPSWTPTASRDGPAARGGAPAPTPTPTRPVPARQPATLDCRIGVQIRRISVCRAAAQ